MEIHLLDRKQRLALPPERAFHLFGEARNLEAITPPWLRFRILAPGRVAMRPGTLIEYRLVLHRIPIRWLTRIEIWDPPRCFVDSQVRGPYRFWEHTHSFEPADGETLMRDVIRYRLPYGPLGSLAHRAFVRRDLERIFDYRGEAMWRVLRAALS